MVGGTVGVIVQSRHRLYKPGDVVVGYWGWQEYAVSDGEEIYRFDTSIAPMSTSLGVLGMPGMTAYFGLLEIGQPGPGETVFVSAAAGAVGSLVGQIAKIKGCRVVGSAGSQTKIDFLLNDPNSTPPLTTSRPRTMPPNCRRSAPTGSTSTLTTWADR
jgi:NADPH-dependent curcumin reductase CurA